MSAGSLLRIMLTCVLALLMVASGRAQPVDGGELPIAVTRLSPRVIVLECLDVNVTAVAADSGLVVIDTGYAPSLMRRMAAVIAREFGRSDFRYVINTHGHWDHCSGNQALPQAKIIGHATCPEFMKHNRADGLGLRLSLQRRLARADAGGDASVPTAAAAARSAAGTRARRMILADLQSGYVLTPPTRTFGDRLTLNLGDLTFALSFAGAAHTDNDLLVYVPQEKLLLTGDLFCGADACCFAVGPLADVPRLAGELARLLQSQAGLETVVPGHGARLGRADLVRLRESLLQRYAGLDLARSGVALLAGIIEKQGVDAALDRYRRLLAADDGAYDFAEEEVNRLADRLRCRGQGDAAIALLELSLARFPQSPLLYDSLGSFHLERGDTAAAIAGFRRCLALFPEYVDLSELVKALGG